MYLDLFESKTLNAMEGYMERLSQRQKIVASNLANIDTPGYKTKDISFHATIDELLAEKNHSGHLRMTRSRHIEAEPYGPSMNKVFEPQGLLERVDGNNVDIDWEMMKMSETAFGYSMVAQLLRGKYQKLSTSINEGRGAQ
jgi:flagellar basal-body rod protein FlgB